MGSSTGALSTFFFGFACGCTGGGIAMSVMNHAGAAMIFAILAFIFVVIGVIFAVPGVKGDNAPKGVVIAVIIISTIVSLVGIIFLS